MWMETEIPSIIEFSSCMGPKKAKNFDSSSKIMILESKVLQL